jgi:NTP pyrophosphatase (non-canonical NTP hydrolase)
MNTEIKISFRKVKLTKISEVQKLVKEILKAYKIKRSPLASLLGVYEELGELIKF